MLSCILFLTMLHVSLCDWVKNFVCALVLAHLWGWGKFLSLEPILNNFFKQLSQGAQWLSGRVLDSRPRDCGFEPYQRHCAVSLSKTHLSFLITGSTQEDLSKQNWKIVNWDVKNQIKQTNRATFWVVRGSFGKFLAWHHNSTMLW